MRLLLVEDEEGFAEALCTSLKMEHYITDWAKDGDEGLTLGLSGVYDVIILDIMLPKMNGLTVLQNLRAHTRRQPGLTAPMELAFGDIYMLQGSNELYCRTTGNSLPLNGKEYQLMEYLLRNAGQIINREQIIEKIWGYDPDTEYNNVEVYISFLRKKLAFLKADTSIKTIRKLGYKLTEER